jgi:hypothetical protein
MVRIPFHGFLEIDIKTKPFRHCGLRIFAMGWFGDVMGKEAKPLGFSILHYGTLIFV